MDSATTPTWLTANEAAAYLKVKPRSLLRWVREGMVPDITKDRYESISAWLQGGGK